MRSTCSPSSPEGRIKMEKTTRRIILKSVPGLSAMGAFFTLVRPQSPRLLSESLLPRKPQVTPTEPESLPYSRVSRQPSNKLRVHPLT